MKVILTADVPGIGSADSIVSVSPGYARNHLLPRKLAIPATISALRDHEKRAGMRLAEDKGEHEHQDALARKVADLVVVVHARANEQGLLYGSVTREQIAEALAALSAPVAHDEIILNSPLTRIGQYVIELRLRPDLQASVRLNIERQ